MKRLTSKIKIFSFTLIMAMFISVVGWVFWDQELKYALPTPVPANFVDVKVGTKIDLHPEIQQNKKKYTVMHFFNFDCPCSRFNMTEFESIAHKYQREIDFFVVIQSTSEKAVEQFREKYELNIPVILDKSGALSGRCGIYATPQAVILDQNSMLYFKGNYNKARFCTSNETKFVEMAIRFLLQKKPLPLFMQYAVSETYGCSLPSDKGNSVSNALF